MKLVSSAVAVITFCSFFVGWTVAYGYFLSDSVVGPEFFDAFTFQTIADPSRGTVFVCCYIYYLTSMP